MYFSVLKSYTFLPFTSKMLLYKIYSYNVFVNFFQCNTLVILHLMWLSLNWNWKLVSFSQSFVQQKKKSLIRVDLIRIIREELSCNKIKDDTSDLYYAYFFFCRSILLLVSNVFLYYTKIMIKMAHLWLNYLYKIIN